MQIQLEDQELRNAEAIVKKARRQYSKLIEVYRIAMIAISANRDENDKPTVGVGVDESIEDFVRNIKNILSKMVQEAEELGSGI